MSMEGWMADQALSARAKYAAALAACRGTSLAYYATAYESALPQLNHTKAQLERKRLWPPTK
jgi:hypothetical protein